MALFCLAFLFVVQLVTGIDHVKLCINDMNKDASNFLRQFESVNPELDTMDWTQEYTAPMTDPPEVVTVPPEFAIATSQMSILQGSSLHNVRIDPKSMYGRAQLINLEYLLMLDPDNLVYSFRNNSGLPTAGIPYGGWEAPNQELRGHFVGHYLSASAKMWASTHNGTLKKRMDYIVDVLGECQNKIGTGYLSAFPDNFFTRVETYRSVWAPYYTMHKIMAGLLDQYEIAGNQKALKIVVWMVQYFTRRIENYVSKYSIEAFYQAQNEETGGMNDVLYQLYTITGNPEHLRLAHLFDKPCFLGPLAIQTDTLSNLHANTHLPILIGVQRRYEVTGEQTYKDLATFLLDTVNSAHRYVTGGTTHLEFWVDPNRMGTTLHNDVEESCSTYNMLKITRNVFRWTRNVSYADHYERLLLNGVMTIQRGEPGVMIYMLAMGHGMAKTSSTLGWGSPFDSFWCCYGSGIESFSKLGDSIYFEDNGHRDNDPGAQLPIPTLYVIQFIPSTLRWEISGLILKQSVQQMSASDPRLIVTIDFSKDPDGHLSTASPYSGQVATLNVRVPSWTTNQSQAYYNDDPQDISPGEFFSLQKIWKEGDRLQFIFPATVTLEHVQDDRPEFEKLNALLFGPYVLAGMSHGDYSLGPVDTDNVAEWVVPVSAEDNKQLYSFTVASGEQLGHRNTSLLLDSSTVKGTDWDFQATFKVSTPPVVGATVSFELMDEPERLVAHNGINRDLIIVDKGAFEDGENVISKQNVFFNVVPGLCGEMDMVSFESKDNPGCYLYAQGQRVPAQLRCMDGKNSTFSMFSSFTVQQGLTTYHPMSFIAKGSTRNYVLFPQYAYRDEHYNIYFDMK